MSLSYLNDIWILLAAALYALGTWFLFRELEQSRGRASTRVLVILIVGATWHALNLGASLFAGPVVNLGLGTALSLTSWVVVVLFLFALWRRPLATLGLIVIPYALITIIVTWLWNAPPMPMANLGPSAVAHMLVSIISFGLLALAFCQAIVLLLQEWHLQNKRSGHFFHSLPALETMENILFQVITIGFSLLTVALVSGVFFASEVFGRALVFNHHVILSLAAWIAFGTLLTGRALRGWRGRTAAIWTITSFAILTLAYFGTRFVLEVVLQRR